MMTINTVNGSNDNDDEHNDGGLDVVGDKWGGSQNFTFPKSLLRLILILSLSIYDSYKINPQSL